ncbi:MAG: SMC-Scp complex subunit ScpB [Pseudomonadales bacterium]|jgi:segregation and condensation protein B|nr:SMC-Scp complex subunit ScpB [Pseudomonadales bacterium]MDP7595433.1 SMC-Scp complex subunit ScpB [Pseudomonadales bacterium]HJN49666.1 SMC-Scp complex subunit ScpB [Pseudomonadales bacterium]
MSNHPRLKQIIEGAILAAEQPLSLDRLSQLFEKDPPSRAEIREVIEEIREDCEEKGFELQQIASGYRFQVRKEVGPWVSRLWEERPPRYSRAMLETLALIAYRQPITRGDIEEIRGVSVSTNIMRSLIEREWVRVVGHRDVPGRPALLATTRTFLDYFNLQSLDELPPLSELRDLAEGSEELNLADEPLEIRSLELALGDVDQTADEEQQDDLVSVSEKVAAVQENIRQFVQEDADEDDELDDADWDEDADANGQDLDESIADPSNMDSPPADAADLDDSIEVGPHMDNPPTDAVDPDDSIEVSPHMDSPPTDAVDPDDSIEVSPHIDNPPTDAADLDDSNTDATHTDKSTDLDDSIASAPHSDRQNPDDL